MWRRARHCGGVKRSSQACGVLSEMVKNRGKILVEQMWRVSVAARRSGHVPDAWTKAVLYGAGSGSERGL